MKSRFISRERRLSGIKNTGVQYIPGHTEPLIDLIIDQYLPKDGGKILDLGGGGLRFAIPVASLNYKVTVVDLDPTGLDLNLIYSRMEENGCLEFPNFRLISKNIKLCVDDVFNFLDVSKVNYSLITAFRLLHFFNINEVDTFFKLLEKRIMNDGKIVISTLSPFEENNETYNEVFENTLSIKDNIFYRKFNRSSGAKKLRKEQNLGHSIHLFTENYLKSIAERNGFKMITGNLPSTRIARGYVLTKKF